MVSRRTIRAGSAPSPTADHGRAGDVVVVAGQGPAVGAGGGDGQQVAGGQVGRQPGVPDHDVAALAVPAHHPGQHRRGRRLARGQHARVGGVVQGGPDVVAHPAVHADVGPQPVHVLDRAHRVQRHHGRPDDGRGPARRSAGAGSGRSPGTARPRSGAGSGPAPSLPAGRPPRCRRCRTRRPGRARRSRCRARRGSGRPARSPGARPPRSRPRRRSASRCASAARRSPGPGRR